MRFDVLTLFPEIFSGYMGQSLLKLAIDRGLVDLQLHNIRDWATGKHNQVDDRPFGGGPGMLLMAPPVVECVEAVQQTTPREGQQGAGRLLMLTPQGRRFDQRLAEDLSQSGRLLLLCGRYEGFDQRIVDLLNPEEISVGDFVLNGGEVAAMVIIDAVVRLIPGVLGDERMLEHAQYTRPREYRGLEVPEVLLSGNHPEIAAWREQNRIEKTSQRRADLLGGSPPIAE